MLAGEDAQDLVTGVAGLPARVLSALASSHTQATPTGDQEPGTREDPWGCLPPWLVTASAGLGFESLAEVPGQAP